eukprot:TRINITY_DN20604_c0_g1_i1.p1 TRINITY_DN20604_c0_g1~~TRINITY_DN20604_c0_g1_i1.p1  ORF type:complete len:651 (-),score=121.23 TRINITY_DN20604_c0_g1_i1:67-2019(-)
MQQFIEDLPSCVRDVRLVLEDCEQLSTWNAFCLVARLASDQSVDCLTVYLPDEASAARNQHFLILLAGLRSNRCLRTLHIHGSGIGIDCFGAFADMLKENRSLTSLRLGYCLRDDDSNGLATLAEGLKENQSLQSLDLECCFQDAGNDGLTAFGQAIKENRSLRNIRLHGVGGFREVDSDDLACFAEAWTRNTSIESIELGFCFYDSGDEGLVKFAQALQVNTVLRCLKLWNCFKNVGSEGMAAVALAVKENRSLCCLDIGNCFNGDVEDNDPAIEDSDLCLVAFAEGLKANNSLQRLMLSNCFKLAGDDGLTAFAEALGWNTCLQSLCFNEFCEEAGSHAWTAFAKAIECNNSIHCLNLDACIDDDGLAVLFKAMTQKDNVRKLCLDLKDLEDVLGLAALAEMLRNNRAIQHLQLAGCFGSVDTQGLVAFAQSLKLNTALQNLQLESCFHDVGDDGLVAFAQCLRETTVLRDLRLFDCFSEASAVGLASIAAAVEENTSLQRLHLGRCAVNAAGEVADECLAAFAKALTMNESLRQLDFNNCLEGSTSVGFAILAESVDRSNVLQMFRFFTAYDWFEPNDDSSELIDAAVARNRDLFRSCLSLAGIARVRADAGFASIAEASFRTALISFFYPISEAAMKRFVAKIFVL